MSNYYFRIIQNSKMLDRLGNDDFRKTFWNNNQQYQHDGWHRSSASAALPAACCRLSTRHETWTLDDTEFCKDLGWIPVFSLRYPVPGRNLTVLSLGC